MITWHWGSESVDTGLLHHWLQDTYWAAGRPRAITERALRHSFCISAWRNATMVGCARLITDFAAHAYLADVIVAAEERGRGIGSTMVAKLVQHEAVAGCIITLHTRDAHEVYRPLGFEDRADMVRPRRVPYAPEGR